MQRFFSNVITCIKSFVHADYHSRSILLMTRPVCTCGGALKY